MKRIEEVWKKKIMNMFEERDRRIISQGRKKLFNNISMFILSQNLKRICSNTSTWDEYGVGEFGYMKFIEVKMIVREERRKEEDNYLKRWREWAKNKKREWLGLEKNIAG